MPGIETLLVVLVVGLAAFMTARSVFKPLVSGETHCQCDAACPFAGTNQCEHSRKEEDGRKS